MHAALVKYKGMGDAIADERAMLEARCTKLTERARKKMGEALMNGAGAVGMVKLLDRYATWPSVQAETDAMIQFMVDRLVAAYPLTDLEQMDLVIEEFGCSDAYTHSTLEGLRRNRERLVNVVRDRMLLACKWRDPRDIAKLLKQTRTADRVEDIREVLTGRLQMLCQVVIDDLIPLVESEDFGAVEGTLLKYQSYPEAVKAAWEALREHRDELLRNAKATFRKLLEAHVLAEIDAALVQFAEYAEAVENERAAVVGHRKWLLKNAVIEVRSLLVDPESTVRQLATALKRYEEYPNVGEERQEVHSLIVARVREAVLLDDPASLGVAVDDCEIAEEFAPKDYVQLVAKFNGITEAIKAKMRSALQRNQALELESVVNESLIYGPGLQKERDPLETALKNYADIAKNEIKALLSSGAFMVIEKTIGKYRNYLRATRDDIALLSAHRDQLLSAARSELTAMLQSDDEAAIKLCLVKFEFYGKAVQTHIDQLHRVLKRLVMVDVLHTLSTSNDFTAVVNGLETYKDDSETARAKKALESVVKQRDALVQLAKDTMKILLSSRSFDEVSAALKHHEMYGSFVVEERGALEAWRDYLSVIRELEQRSESDDFGDIQTSLERHAGVLDQQVIAAYRRLQTRRDQMVAAVQMALRELLGYVAPVAMGTALTRYSSYADACPEEFRAVKDKRQALIDEANVKLLEAANSDDITIPAMQELITMYHGFPQEDVKEGMEALTNKLTEAITGSEQVAAQRKKRADEIRARREAKVAAALMGGSGNGDGGPASPEDTKAQMQKAMKQKAMELRMKMQTEEMFQMVDSGPAEGADGADGGSGDAVAAAGAGGGGAGPGADDATAAAAAAAAAGEETEDAVMDGVEAVLSGDMQEAVDNFMNSLKQHPQDPVCAYNLSCCFALMQQTDASVRWFELCVRWGIAAHEELDDPAEDPDLTTVAQDPRFEIALAELRTQRAAHVYT